MCLSVQGIKIKTDTKSFENSPKNRKAEFQKKLNLI